MLVATSQTWPTWIGVQCYNHLSTVPLTSSMVTRELVTSNLVGTYGWQLCIFHCIVDYSHVMDMLPNGVITTIFHIVYFSPVVHICCKQLLDEVFVISKIIKFKLRVISWSQRLILITLTETLIILDITKNKSNNCFVIHWRKQKWE